MDVTVADFDRLAGRLDGAAAELLRRNLAASVRLDRGGPVPQDSPGSRLGGRPLVPPGFTWPLGGEPVISRNASGSRRGGQPRPLSFLGQVDTADVLAHEPDCGLPAATLLTFFYEAQEQRAWGFDPADRADFAVLAVDPATAVAAEQPAGTRAFAPHGLLPRRTTTTPDWREDLMGELDDATYMAVQELYDDLQWAEHERGPNHRMFGWPDLVQGSMPLQCQLVTHGIYLGSREGYRDPRAGALRAGATDWRLLLQLDTDDAPGWTWNDAGTLYFWIREADLRTGRFDRAWAVLQTG